MQKRLLTGLTALTMSLSFNTYVLADPNSNSVEEQQKIISQNKEAVDKVNKSANSIQSNIDALDNEIQATNNQISNNKTKVAEIQKDIRTAEGNIKDAEDKLKLEQDQYSGRIRAIYVNSRKDGSNGYISILLSSRNMSDFLSKISTVKRLSQLDNKIKKDLIKQQKEIEKKKDDLEAENNKVTALLNENTQKLAKLNSDKQNLTELYAKEKSEASKYQAKINAATDAANKMRESVPTFIPSRGATSISSNAVVAYASNFMGTPYVYGGNGPENFDCSGFTKYVFAHFGIGLNRVAADQARQGTPVTDLQPGDLVFFGSSMGSIHHVGIYVGNGCYIHAPHSNSYVQISSLDGSDYYCARRVY